MSIGKILIANRGEIAIRIARTASRLGIQTVGIYSQDDSNSKHVSVVDEAIPLKVKGPAAYLDIEQILEIALDTQSEAIHPGYGFLSESSRFAQRIEEHRIIFLGPNPDTLLLLGDKAKAIALAKDIGIPTLPSTPASDSPESITEFFRINGPLMLKAVSGGGGRGMRKIQSEKDIEALWKIASSEANTAFGDPSLYAEKLITKAKHLEVQVLGDGTGNVVHIGERDCSLQRRHQKVIEITPSPNLNERVRQQIFNAAIQMAQATNYKSLGTFEFLVPLEDPENFVFIEANPRIQVEHTITEEVSGLDLVELQIRIAEGKTLQSLNISQDQIHLEGSAIQFRLNAEMLLPNGTIQPTGGQISLLEPPLGRGIRFDTSGFSGYALNPNFDSLVGKLVVHSNSSDWNRFIKFARSCLAEVRIDGIETNLNLLRKLMEQEEFLDLKFYTDWIDEILASIADTLQSESGMKSKEAGDQLGMHFVRSPVSGTVIEVDVKAGEVIVPGQKCMVISAMKMEHWIESEFHGMVQNIGVQVGDLVDSETILYSMHFTEATEIAESERKNLDLDHIPDTLKDLKARLLRNEDSSRPQAVSKRHKRGQRTARENIADLCDDGSFVEYGALAIAAQRTRKSVEDLIKLSPADGLVAGIGTVNHSLFDGESRCAVLAYDYTVFAGTQGAMNHKKTDRLLQVVKKLKLPIILFAEGGGGRPGEVDVPAVGGLDLTTFASYASLSGLVPRIAIASGRCFAGNAALFGCSDITIATQNSTIGMGGPVMIKGGGLGNVRAEDVGPSSVQAENGVIDVLVEDEIEAVSKAKAILSCFQGDVSEHIVNDQRRLRQIIPGNRLRIYDIRDVIRTLADSETFLELRQFFAPGLITGFVRISGKAMGLIANDCRFLSGAIDANGSDKAARFLQLCDAFSIPVVSLCDTPGFMVGPKAEQEALVRHSARLFTVAASMNTPVFTVVLRRGYGLGAMAMAGGGFHDPIFTISWPSGEFGPMGIEGEVQVGYQKELSEEKDWKKRDELFRQLVEKAYQRGKATNTASFLEIDAVIDPSDTRKWILAGLESLPKEKKTGKRMVDTW